MNMCSIWVNAIPLLAECKLILRCDSKGGHNIRQRPVFPPSSVISLWYGSCARYLWRCHEHELTWQRQVQYFAWLGLYISNQQLQFMVSIPSFCKRLWYHQQGLWWQSVARVTAPDCVKLRAIRGAKFQWSKQRRTTPLKRQCATTRADGDALALHRNCFQLPTKWSQPDISKSPAMRRGSSFLHHSSFHLLQSSTQLALRWVTLTQKWIYCLLSKLLFLSQDDRNWDYYRTWFWMRSSTCQVHTWAGTECSTHRPRIRWSQHPAPPHAT